MLSELDQQHYHEVAPLFESLASFLLAIPSSLNQMTPAIVLTDQFPDPQLVLLHSVEGNYLVGTPHSTSINALKHYLAHRYFTVDRRFFYCCVSDVWTDVVPTLFGTDNLRTTERQHYTCSSLEYNEWQSQLPDDYQVIPIDEQLLASENVIIPSHIHSWINNNWGSNDHYLEHGFGMCIQHDNHIVSWSVADCITDDRCEIGIHTHAGFRQRGLAAITAAACVDYALAHGFKQVGWHCNADNIGSRQTAKKVGFIKNCDYFEYWVAAD